ISTLANLVNAIAVTAGVIFAATQIRDYRRQRRRESMLSLVRSFQSPTFAQALRRVVELPSDTSGKQIQEILGPSGEDMIAHLTGTWESIGVLVFHNELTLDVVDDFFSGPIVLSWKKLRPYVEHQRKSYSRQGVETTSQFMGNQKPDGELLDALRWKKESNPGVLVSHAFQRAEDGDRSKAVRDLLQIRLCSQSLGPRRFSV